MTGCRGRRRPPIVVEIDVENDEYVPIVWGESAWQGVPLAFATMEAARAALAAEGHPAHELLDFGRPAIISSVDPAGARWLVTAADGPRGDLVTPEEAFLNG